LFTLLAGAAAFFPALIFQRFLNFPLFAGGRVELFFHFFVRIAFTEELSRFLILLIFFWSSNIRTNAAEQPSYNAVKYGAAAGLIAGFGFAILENTLYGAADFNILLLRTITAAPLHAACGSRVGAAAVMFRSSRLQAVLRFFTAVAIHGIYNFMIALPGLPSIAAILVVISAFASSIMTIRGGWENTQHEYQPS